MSANIYIDPEAQKLLDDYRSKALSIDIQTSTFDYFIDSVI